MRKLCLLALVVACAPAHYYYNFDIAEPNAKNDSMPGAADVVEDGDVRMEMLIDPVNFQAISLNVANKTDQVLGVNWAQISVINPDGQQAYLKPDADLGWVQPGTKVSARLVPFQLPSIGAAAAAYDGAKFILVVPAVVRGNQKEYRYHLVAQALKR